MWPNPCLIIISISALKLSCSLVSVPEKYIFPAQKYVHNIYSTWVHTLTHTQLAFQLSCVCVGRPSSWTRVGTKKTQGFGQCSGIKRKEIKNLLYESEQIESNNDPWLMCCLWQCSVEKLILHLAHEKTFPLLYNIGRQAAFSNFQAGGNFRISHYCQKAVIKGRHNCF